jgi:hypothetical protein
MFTFVVWKVYWKPGWAQPYHWFACGLNNLLHNAARFIKLERVLKRNYKGQCHEIFWRCFLSWNNSPSNAPLCLIQWAVFTPWSICHQKFFSKPVLMLVPNTPSRFTIVSSQRSWGSPVYSSLGSHYRHWIVSWPILRSIQLTLKGLSF